MENKNQKPKLSLKEIFKIQNEICESKGNCVENHCPFDTEKCGCIVSDIDNWFDHADEIERICTEWEMNKPTLAEKIDEILKPYGMKLMDGKHCIWFDDENMEFHSEAELVNKLYTTKWKGKPNE